MNAQKLSLHRIIMIALLTSSAVTALFLYAVDWISNLMHFLLVVKRLLIFNCEWTQALKFFMASFQKFGGRRQNEYASHRSLAELTFLLSQKPLLWWFHFFFESWGWGITFKCMLSASSLPPSLTSPLTPAVDSLRFASVQNMLIGFCYLVNWKSLLLIKLQSSLFMAKA